MGTIKNFIEKIKSARYGKDVRQSIVDAIEQTYSDAISNGHTDMEVAKARDTYNDLNSRLEADKNKIEEKIENEETDRKEALEDIQKQVSGLAREGHLVASNVSEMTDTNRTYVNTSDGNWYYYNGNNWTVGGVYQASEIEDKSITAKKTDFALDDSVEKTINLFDKTTEVMSITGVTDVAQASYKQFVNSNLLKSVIMPIKPNKTITIEKDNSSRFRIFTSTESPKVGETFNQYFVNDGNNQCVFESGENDNYILISFYNISYDSDIDIDELKNSMKVFYGVEWIDNDKKATRIEIPLLKLQNNSVEPENTTFIEKSGTENLYDVNTPILTLVAVTDIALDTYGTFANSSKTKGIVLSVKPNTQYTIEKILSERFTISTSNKYPAKDVNYNKFYNCNGTTKKTITTEENDNYIYVVIYNSDIDTIDINSIISSIKFYVGNQFVKSSYKMKNVSVDAENIDCIEERENSLFMPSLKIIFNNLSNEIINLLSYRPLGTLDKGYLCLVADDGNMSLATNTFNILKSKNVPCTFALMSNSPIMNEITGDIKGLKEMINDYGCSVCQHGSSSFFNYTEEELLQYFREEKKFWESKEITVNGICYPNHEHNKLIQSICGSIYDVCAGGFGNNIKSPVYNSCLNGAHSNIFELTRISLVSFGTANLQNAINSAIENKQLLIVFWHDKSIQENTNYQAELEEFIDYAKGRDIEFITLDKIKNI